MLLFPAADLENHFGRRRRDRLNLKPRINVRRYHYRKSQEARGVIKADSGANLDASGLENAMVIDRRREVELILHRKFKSSERVRKDKRPMRRSAAKVTPSQRVFEPHCWIYVVRIFAYAIRLYSCSVARYAMFRSNRSLKPGD